MGVFRLAMMSVCAPSTFERRILRLLENATAALAVVLTSSCEDVAGSEAGVSCSQSDHPRISNGTDTEPYLGLSTRQQHAIGLVFPEWARTDIGRPAGCTGTMIAPGWVLTAAHCSPPAGTSLAFSVFDTSDVEIATWWSHRIIEHEILDLMLLELAADPQEIDAALDPIALADGFTPALGSLVTLAGLGQTEEQTRGSRRFVVEPVVEVSDEQLAVDGEGRTGACAGDSGGPMLARVGDGTVRVIGVLSAGSVDCLGRDLYVRSVNGERFFADLPSPQCLSADCGGIGQEGRCFGSISVWCDGAEIHARDCTPDRACGWSQAEQGYRCVSADEDPCSGSDAWGHCLGHAARHCDHGVLTVRDCHDEGLACGWDASGRAGCR